MADQAEKEWAQDSLLDRQFEVGILDSANVAPFLPLLLPETAKALRWGEPLTLIGMAEDEVACGCLAGYARKDCFHITSLYVAPDYRRRGGARRMLRKLERMIFEEGSIFALAIEFFDVLPDNETLPPFLDETGFHIESDRGRNIYSFLLRDLAHINTSHVSNSCGGGVIVPFSELSDDKLRHAQKRSVVLGTPRPVQQLMSKELERELSFALVLNNRIEAYVVVDHSCCEMLTVCALWVGEASPATLIPIIKTLIAKVRQLYPPDTPVAMQAINEESLRLITQLAPNAKKVYYSYRKFL